MGIGIEPNRVDQVVSTSVDDGAEKATALRLEYKITDGHTEEKTTRDYRILLEYSEYNFGGEL